MSMVWTDQRPGTREITYLEITKFIPRIRRCFGHFLLTIRSVLRDTRGSRRQIVHFIGLFQHLGDLKLLFYDWVDFREDPLNDLALILSFVPPPSLQERPAVTRFTRIGLLEE